MDVHCGFCGTVVSVPDDQTKVVCNKCGMKIFDLQEFEKKRNNLLKNKELLTPIKNTEKSKNVNYKTEINNNETSVHDEAAAKTLKNKKLIVGVAVTAISLIVILLALYPTVIKPMQYYKNAENYAANGDYGVAINLLQHIDTERGHEMMEEYLSDIVDAGKFDELDNIFANSFYGNNSIDDKDALVMTSISKKLAYAGQHSFALGTLRNLDYDIAKVESFTLAEEYEMNGDNKYAAMYYGVAGDYEDSRDRSFALWEDIVGKNTFDAGENHTVAVTTYGSVYATGDNEFGQCDVEDWTDIVSVAAGYSHTVGLKSDGTVVAVGDNEDEQCEVSEWTNIVAIDAGNDITIGLKSDGTIVFCGSTTLMYGGLYNLDCVVDFSVYCSAVFIKADGSLVGVNGNFTSCGESLVDDWTDIQDVSVGYQHTIGLKKDSTIIATEFESEYEYFGRYYSQCEVDGVDNVVAVSAGGYHTAVVFTNGRAGAVGLNGNGQCEVSGLSNLIDVSAGEYHTVYLKKDGTLVAVGDNEYGQCDVEEWTNIETRI